MSPTSNPDVSAGVSGSIADTTTGLLPWIRKPNSSLPRLTTTVLSLSASIISMMTKMKEKKTLIKIQKMFEDCFPFTIESIRSCVKKCGLWLIVNLERISNKVSHQVLKTFLGTRTNTVRKYHDYLQTCLTRKYSNHFFRNRLSFSDTPYFLCVIPGLIFIFLSK